MRLILSASGTPSRPGRRSSSSGRAPMMFPAGSTPASSPAWRIRSIANVRPSVSAWLNATRLTPPCGFRPKRERSARCWFTRAPSTRQVFQSGSWKPRGRSSRARPPYAAVRMNCRLSIRNAAPLVEHDREAVAQDLRRRRPARHFRGVEAHSNHRVGTQLPGVLDHQVVGSLACLLAHLGVGADLSADDALQPAEDSLRNRRRADRDSPDHAPVLPDPAPFHVERGRNHDGRLHRHGTLLLACTPGVQVSSHRPMSQPLAVPASSPVTPSRAPARSLIGQKIVMAVTGVILFMFVVGHLLGNLKVFQGPEHFNAYAEGLRTFGAPFLGRGQLLWIARIILLGSVA